MSWVEVVYRAPRRKISNLARAIGRSVEFKLHEPKLPGSVFWGRRNSAPFPENCVSYILQVQQTKLKTKKCQPVNPLITYSGDLYRSVV